MKKIFVLVSCLMLAMCSMAQDRFYIENFNIEPGETKTVAILLDNVTTFSAIQADIFLPEGLSIDKEDGDYIFDLTDRKARNHTASSALVSNGAIRLLISSQTSRTFSGNSGALVTFQLTASSDFSGPKNIVMNNIIASEADMTQHNLPDESCTVTSSSSVEPSTETLPLNIKMAKMQPGTTLQLAVTKDGVGSVNWSSEDESVAVVDANGIVTAIKTGLVAINAVAADGASAWCAIFVYLPGDANEDGYRTIADVSTLIDMLLDE
jgi:uncharacterized protein YjdB